MSPTHYSYNDSTLDRLQFLLFLNVPMADIDDIQDNVIIAESSSEQQIAASEFIGEQQCRKTQFLTEV